MGCFGAERAVVENEHAMGRKKNGIVAMGKQSLSEISPIAHDPKNLATRVVQTVYSV